VSLAKVTGLLVMCQECGASEFFKDWTMADKDAVSHLIHWHITEDDKVFCSTCRCELQLKGILLRCNPTIQS